jgi:hypothetical protein
LSVSVWSISHFLLHRAVAGHLIVPLVFPIFVAQQFVEQSNRHGDSSTRNVKAIVDMTFLRRFARFWVVTGVLSSADQRFFDSRFGSIFAAKQAVENNLHGL